MKTMKLKSSILAIALLTVFMANALAAAPSAGSKRQIFQTDFASGDALAGWNVSGPGTAKLETGYQGGQSLAVEQPLAKGAGSTSATIALPVEKLRNARLSLRAMIKAEDVASPPYPWNGVKFMLVVATPGGPQYPSRGDLAGTFDWRQVTFDATIPADATSVTLVLGIEATTGKAWFDDIHIDVKGRAFGAPPVVSRAPLYNGHPGIPRLRGAMVSPDLTADDVHVLATDWGANLIRYQIVTNDPKDGWDSHGWKSRAAYDAWLEKRLAYLDKMLPVFRKEGLKIVVDLHSPDGGNYDRADWPIFRDKALQAHFLRVWDRIARRYRDSDVVWAYDLVNEPNDSEVGDGCLDWRDLATAAAKIVRKIDTRHVILVEPFGGQVTALKYLDPIPVSNVIYSVHMYDPAPFTMQGVSDGFPMGVHYPGTIGGGTWDKAKLAAELDEVVEYQKRYHVAIYVGEFSAIRWAPAGEARRYLSDLIDIFEKNGWDWSYHAFREWQGWSVEYGSDKDATAPETKPTDRLLLLKSWYVKNVKAK